MFKSLTLIIIKYNQKNNKNCIKNRERENNQEANPFDDQKEKTKTKAYKILPMDHA